MCSAPVGEGANLRRELSLGMLIGAHVSTGGALPNAIAGDKGVGLYRGAQKTDPLKPSLERAPKVIAEALKETDSCPLLIEQTAGHKGLLARDFDQTAELIDLAGGGERLGLCLDSCHLFV